MPIELKTILELIPSSSHPMEVMRTICSFLGNLEPESPSNPQQQIAVRLIAVFGPAICYWWHFSQHKKRIEVETGQDSVAENFCKLILDKREVDPLVVKTVDVSLILYAEHDFNASTFAARVTVSTLSDIYSGICTGIGIITLLKGL